ncbi:hypothetical protein [Couchioplanes caeruleus]|uniref:DUF998 domain-containing protein n=2 Tax=Couchioplanes caeruleus TaxID=56438 RepID=A0A1K0H0M0_9ACTN|nr:hypothetical protein [Couchioplanes caeruleus]OJF15227.1 hypothetical protein BG844_05615 [Couchioplanes caeruleus subsp. caeruleus]ROP33587.1 hypothetical protein EDD30_6592 [Couchioplanes caeruleus]
MITAMGKHNARRDGTALVQLAVVLSLVGFLYAVNIWLTPQILRLTCQATDCAPRAVAIAGWATIAGVPAAIGLLLVADRRADGWRYLLTLAVAALLAAPGVGLLPDPPDSEFVWAAFGAAPGLDAYRTGVHVARLAFGAGGLLYAVCRILVLLDSSADSARRFTLAGRAIVGLAIVASLTAVLVRPAT